MFSGSRKDVGIDSTSAKLCSEDVRQGVGANLWRIHVQMASMLIG